MKKIALGIAALTLSASILGACSNGEATSTNKNEDNKQEAKADTTKPSAMKNGVQFVYNDKEVTNKDLKAFQEEYLVGIPPKELDSLGSEFIAKNYIVTNELLKYVGSSKDELKKEYDAYKEGVTDKATQMNFTEYVVQFLSDKLVAKELDTEKKQKALYNQLDAKDKESMSFEQFSNDKFQMFHSAKKRNVIDVKKLQDNALSKAKIENKSLNVDKKLTENEYMPF